MRIQKLTEKTIRQIAAGEVISRPSNALKELIENAIDAKSSHITIHVNKGGLEELIIIDNGEGMDVDDLKICTQMHTTSKTQEDAHIFGVNSLGFRGEALASIDIISNLSIETRGKKLENDKITPSNIETGTKVRISNMFANVPARLKFIKNSNIENSNIKQIIQKYIINFENIGWEIFNNGKQVWHFEPCSKEERIIQLTNDEPVFFQNEYNEIKLSGYILKTSLNPPLKSHKFLAEIFVNNRPIKDRAISYYIKSILSEYFMKHEVPSYVLFIELDPFLIDCNVHPSKEEIKFINYAPIFSMLTFSLCPEFFHKLRTPNFSSNVSYNKEPMRITRPKYEHKEIKLDFAHEGQISYVNETVDITFAQPTTAHKIIGQIKNSYVVFEIENGIGIFDQHAAHERHVYEKMKKELSAQNAQTLLSPICLNLNAEQQEYLNTNSEKLKTKGILISGNTLTHIPNILQKTNFAALLEQIDPHTACEIAIDRLLADIACKNALKANTKLSAEQMASLLEDAMKNPPVCNHGRPVFKYFKLCEIENWFKRT